MDQFGELDLRQPDDLRMRFTSVSPMVNSREGARSPRAISPASVTYVNGVRRTSAKQKAGVYSKLDSERYFDVASDAIISSTFRDDAAGREHSRFESALVMRLNQALADDRAGRTIPHAKVRQQMRSALKKRIAKRG